MQIFAKYILPLFAQKSIFVKQTSNQQMRTDFLHVLGIIAASAILEALCPPSDYSENTPFVIETKGATGVGSYEATLNAYIDITGINFNEVSYGFFWGTSYDSLDYEIKCESTRTLSNPKFSYSAQLATLDPKTKYWFKAYIKFGNNIYYGDTKSFSTTAFKMVAVDLGLSVKWASCNLGATSPSDSGDYFAWGETTPKSRTPIEGDWEHYKWCKGSKDKLTKYCSVFDEWAGTGLPDNKTVLDPTDDAAHVILGSNWRMPTDKEWAELRENCTWERKGDDGYVVTSKINGDSIFLPTTAYAYSVGVYNRLRAQSICSYWTSSIPGQEYRAKPRPIRPVYDIPVSLNTSALLLYKGETKKLIATVSQAKSESKEVRWVSSDTSVAIVSSEGVVSAVSAGTALITVNTVVGGHAASCSVTVSDKPLAVDLGLTSGVKWASFNIGASIPEEFGDYYAWGETEPYYKKLNPLTWNSKTFGYNKESYKSRNRLLGYDKYVMKGEYDVAHVRLGGKWRMPTYEEWQELEQQCTWSLTTCNGVKGYVVKSKRNGNSIFLPAAGYFNDRELLKAGSGGWYWSSSIISFDVVARYKFFDNKSFDEDFASDRYYGRSVRPVCLEDILPTQVSLNSSDLSLITGDKRQLTVTVIPAEATNKSVTWVSSNSRVVSVNSDGVISAHAAGSATITVTTILGGLTATCSVTVSGRPVAVDLGLPSGIKWASFNLGASAPEEYGDYYAWGEPEPYYISQNPLTWKVGKTDGYNWSSYNWWNGSSSTLTKYNKKASNGAVDNKTMLEEMDDAAHIRLGDRWRIPSAKEWKELKKRCKWIRTKRNNVSGYEVTGPNGNSIFLPATGLRSTTDLSWSESGGYYWSSSLSTDSRCAWCLYFYLNDVHVFKNYGRSLGFAIRPVSE